MIYFDENIRPVFQEDRGVSYTRALETQDDILAFVNDYLALFGMEAIELNSGQQFLSTLFGLGCQMIPPATEAFVHDDIWEVSDSKDRPVSVYDLWLKANC